MIDKNSVLFKLYSDSFLEKVEDKRIIELTQKKVDKFKQDITPLIKDDKTVEGIMELFEDFIVDYSEVENIQNFECYKLGWRDREKVQNEINQIKR